jgi:hypothetical protein
LQGLTRGAPQAQNRHNRAAAGGRLTLVTERKNERQGLFVDQQ